MPTAIVRGAGAGRAPPASGPTLPSNPSAASAARLSPSERGTAPVVATGTPTASAVFGSGAGDRARLQSWAKSGRMDHTMLATRVALRRSRAAMIVRTTPRAVDVRTRMKRHWKKIVIGVVVLVVVVLGGSFIYAKFINKADAEFDQRRRARQARRHHHRRRRPARRRHRHGTSRPTDDRRHHAVAAGRRRRRLGHRRRRARSATASTRASTASTPPPTAARKPSPARSPSAAPP